MRVMYKFYKGESYAVVLQYSKERVSLITVSFPTIGQLHRQRSSWFDGLELPDAWKISLILNENGLWVEPLFFRTNFCHCVSVPFFCWFEHAVVNVRDPVHK